MAEDNGDDDLLYGGLESPSASEPALDLHSRPATNGLHSNSSDPSQSPPPSISRTPSVSSLSSPHADSNGFHPLALASPPSSTSTPASSPPSSLSLNNPEDVDDSSYVWVRLRNVHHGAKPYQVLDFLHHHSPLTLYYHLGPTGKPTGEYFAAFAPGTPLQELLALQDRRINDRPVEVYESSKGEQRAAHRRSTGDDKRKVREDAEVVKLVGLPFTVRELAVERWLSEGGVSWIADGLHMPVDQLGRPNGRCLVELPDDDEMERVLRMNRLRLLHRFIEVSPMTPQEFVDEMTTESVPLMRRPPSNGSREYSTQWSASNSAPSQPLQRESSQGSSSYVSRWDRRPAPPAPQPQSTSSASLSSRAELPPVSLSVESLDCMRVSDIAPDVDDGELTRFFLQAGVRPLRLHRTLTLDTAYLEFNAEADAEKAFALRKLTLQGRRLEFTLITRAKVDKALRPGSPPRGAAYRRPSSRSRSRSRERRRDDERDGRERRRSRSPLRRPDREDDYKRTAYRPREDEYARERSAADVVAPTHPVRVVTLRGGEAYKVRSRDEFDYRR